MAETYLGDYPQPLPGVRRPRSLAQLATHGPQLPPWMLLSLNKPATASSGGANASAATDEDIRTWWAAESAAAGEWYAVELGGPYTVHAVQINFADEGCGILGGRPKASDAYRYFLEWRPPAALAAVAAAAAVAAVAAAAAAAVARAAGCLCPSSTSAPARATGLTSTWSSLYRCAAPPRCASLVCTSLTLTLPTDRPLRFP